MNRTYLFSVIAAGGAMIAGVTWLANARQSAQTAVRPPLTRLPLVTVPDLKKAAVGAGDAPESVKIRPAKRERPTMTPYDPHYDGVIKQTAQMVSDPEAQRLARQKGLSILNLTWEDTGRYKNSAVGPNISDMTIQVGQQNPKTDRFTVTCMPVIRYPNFSDRSCDLDPRDFTLLAGNQNGAPLKRLSLYDFLANPTAYLSHPASWKAEKKTLLAPRDSKVLVSAQACFLPVPQRGIAHFNPVLFNYQSYGDDPAVLTVLATREGTSVTVIDNKRDAFASGSVWGQRIYHNQNGQRASLTGQRLTDFVANEQERNPDSAALRPAARAGLNMVLLIQIPLKQKERPQRTYDTAMAMPMAAVGAVKYRGKATSNVENAVIGHGEEEGPFTEIGDLKIERDERFPVRVTVQFYKATSNGVVSAEDLDAIKAQIDQVYDRSDYVGSLVTQGETGRVTEYDGVKVEPADWWERFWERHERETGDSREEAIKKLKELLGENYQAQSISDLYLRTVLKTAHR